MDPFASFKEAQKQGWTHFAGLATFTTPPAARLVRYAGVGAAHQVLDVACGTGVVAITARRAGARVAALDLTPALLEHARDNAAIAGVDVDFRQGDAEALPFDASTFDIVLSQFGHIFAPRPDVAMAEMLRVLKPGGVLAFSTWPPDFFIGRTMALAVRYMPEPPPIDVPPPSLWGQPSVVRERLGAGVRDIVFDTARMHVPALSPAHYRRLFESAAGPARRLVSALEASDPARLAAFRREYEALVAEYFDGNLVHQDFLMTRAIKV